MRKILILAAIAAALLPRQVFAIAASQAWVKDYVTNYVAQTTARVETTTSNGVTTVRSGSESKFVELEYEEPTDRALLAANCTSAAVSQGVTNGTLFVWNGAGAYVNPAGNVTATETCLVFDGVESVHVYGYERFEGLFDAKGVLIQPVTSYAVTNGMEVVR